MECAEGFGTSVFDLPRNSCSHQNATTCLARDATYVLQSQTVRYGFNNVIDAFHVVRPEPVPFRFFVDERKSGAGIRNTDEFSALLSATQANNLPDEAEARWRLVETAWSLGLAPSLLSVAYDTVTEMLFTVDSQMRRRAITGSRTALNGYQKGKCFYCFADLQLNAIDCPEVDHFFPHVLKQNKLGPHIDGIWNLVLACRYCNRGIRGKMARVPTLRLVERLSRRNEFLIASHHPLRETLMQQTGQTPQARHTFLNNFHTRARTALIHTWEAEEIDAEPF
jgi:hypothetical protein